MILCAMYVHMCMFDSDLGHFVVHGTWYAYYRQIDQRLVTLHVIFLEQNIRHQYWKFERPCIYEALFITTGHVYFSTRVDYTCLAFPGNPLRYLVSLPRRVIKKVFQNIQCIINTFFKWFDCQTGLGSYHEFFSTGNYRTEW